MGTDTENKINCTVETMSGMVMQPLTPTLGGRPGWPLSSTKALVRPYLLKTTTTKPQNATETIAVTNRLAAKHAVLDDM